ncbi:MAG: SurA N-terminal domain-containing protein [Bacteroidales bacterium]|nr:SurA N-terminal domain-containing protein [Bacteroidales bacterium]MDY0334172.1 SurA N-terminal domain-containing protein [Bacteroidales bacterium]
MAAIGQIRKHSGLLIVIIGVALAAFVLGDFLKPRNTNPRLYVGEVAGEEISSEAFSMRVEERTQATKNQRQSENLSQDDLFQIRQAVWNEMVNEILLTRQYEKLGLAVTSDELTDQIVGEEPHQYVKQSFTDPNSGNFDPSVVVNFLQNLDRADPEMRKRYLSLEAMIKDDLRKTKYQNLLTKAWFMPTAFAKLDYERINSTANIVYTATMLSTIADTAVTVTDQDLKKYYDDNKAQYKQEASRTIDYVVFPVQPSSDDRKEIAAQVNELYAEFINIKDDATFVNSSSDTRIDTTYKKESELPARVASQLMEAEIGTVVGPYIESDVYYMSKVLDRAERSDSLKISQILISYATAPAAAGISERTAKRARTLVDSLNNVLQKNPGKFEEIAVQFSDYPSAADDKGDLGWVIDGNAGMSNFYNKGKNMKVNEVAELETALGYHLVKLTDKTNPLMKVKIATLTRNIVPSDLTYQQAYMKANTFAGENNTRTKFDTAVVSQGLNKRTAERLNESSNRIAGVENARQLVRWAFEEKRPIDAVSNVFEDDDQFIVATLTNIREKGFTPLEEVKEQIRPLVVNQKKADLIAKRISDLNAQSIEQIAESMNQNVDSVAVSYASRNLPGFGSEYELIGTIFTLEPGKVSEPIKGNNAVFVVKVTDVTQATPTEDYSATAGMLERRFTSRVPNSYMNVLKEDVKINDNRLMIY